MLPKPNQQNSTGLKNFSKQKAMEIKQEQQIKQEVTKRPFNMSLIKNSGNIVHDSSPQATRRSPKTIKKQETAKPKRNKANDGDQAFTQFLLGKPEMDEKEQEEMERQQNENKLKGLLRKKEQEGGMLGSVERNLIKRLSVKLNMGTLENKEEEIPEVKSRSGLTPLVSDSEELEEDVSDSSSEEDVEGKMRYKNAAYWQLPENVRQAVDVARSKSKHSDFYNRLRSLNTKIGVYKKVFYTRIPRYETMYYERKKERLEEILRQEQRELEAYMMQEAMRDKQKNGKRFQYAANMKRSTSNLNNQISSHSRSPSPLEESGKQSPNYNRQFIGVTSGPHGTLDLRSRNNSKLSHKHKSSIDVDKSYKSPNRMDLNLDISPVRDQDDMEHLQRSPKGPKMSVPVNNGELEPVLEEGRAQLLLNSSQSDEYSGHMAREIMIFNDDDTIDQDILKDIDEYQKEYQNTAEEDEDQAGGIKVSPSSPMFKLQMEEMNQNERVNNSQDSPRRMMENKKLKSKEASTNFTSRVDKLKQKSRILDRRGSQETTTTMKRQKIQEQKQYRKLMQDRISNILIDIDKSILEINQQNVHGKVLFRLGQQKALSKPFKQKRKKVPKDHDKSKLQGTIPEMNEDMAAVIEPKNESPSIFKIKLAEYKENHQNLIPPSQNPLDPNSGLTKNITDSFQNLNLDRDLNNLISKKPNRQDRYGEQEATSSPQKKKNMHKDLNKMKKSQQEPPGKPYSTKNSTALVKRPLKIQIGHHTNPLDIGMDQNLHNDGSTGGNHGFIIAEEHSINQSSVLPQMSKKQLAKARESNDDQDEQKKHKINRKISNKNILSPKEQQTRQMVDFIDQFSKGKLLSFPASQTPHGRKLSNIDSFKFHHVRQTSQDYHTPNQRVSHFSNKDEQDQMNLTQVQMNIEKIKNLKDVHQLRVEKQKIINTYMHSMKDQSNVPKQDGAFTHVQAGHRQHDFLKGSRRNKALATSMQAKYPSDGNQSILSHSAMIAHQNSSVSGLPNVQKLNPLSSANSPTNIGPRQSLGTQMQNPNKSPTTVLNIVKKQKIRLPSLNGFGKSYI